MFIHELQKLILQKNLKIKNTQTIISELVFYMKGTIFPWDLSHLLQRAKTHNYIYLKKLVNCKVLLFWQRLTTRVFNRLIISMLHTLDQTHSSVSISRI